MELSVRYFILCDDVQADPNDLMHFPMKGVYWVELLDGGAVVARQALSLTA